MASDVADDMSNETAPLEPPNSSTAADSVIRRNTGDLEEMMRRRREKCKEFESAPQSSTADACATFASDAGQEAAPADAANDDGEAPASPKAVASAPSMSFVPKPRQTGDLNTWRNAVGAANGIAKASSSDKFARAGQKSVSELHSWMEQMRKRCEELESTPEPTVADVQSADFITKAPAASEQDVPVDVAGVEPVRRQRKDPEKLNELLTQMRNRCEVVESTPEETTADVRHEVAPDVQHNIVTSAAPAPATSEPAAPAQGTESEELQPASPAVAAPASRAEAVRAQLQGGTPLSDAERVEFWSTHLCLDNDATGGGDIGEHVLKSSAALNKLLNGQATETSNESMNCYLATAFSKKYVSWLAGRQLAVMAVDDNGSSSHTIAFFAQLLRYHFPVAACAVEAVASAARSAARAAQPGEPVPSGLDLKGTLDAACGGPLGLAELLFTPQDQAEASALKLVCDFVVLEEEDLLLAFVAVVCLAHATKALSGNMEQVQAGLRSGFVLGAASACDGGVAGCVADALSLLERTPVTLLSALACGHGSVEMPLPMCTIAPDEVLHHIYETPGRNWRLIVVDARMLPSKVALPICMRLGPTAHKNRRQMLRDTAEEESIHMCLMGDGAPLPGDDAFELCRYLVGQNVQRRHISVVDGGWPAVAKLAYSLRLHLMPVEPEVGEAPAAVDENKFQQAQEKARAKVAEVAEHMARDVAEATAAGQKVARKLIRGAGRGIGRALERLNKDDKSGRDPATDSSSH